MMALAPFLNSNSTIKTIVHNRSDIDMHGIMATRNFFSGNPNLKKVYFGKMGSRCFNFSSIYGHFSHAAIEELVSALQERTESDLELLYISYISAFSVVPLIRGKS